jgi:hypothetical protein
MLRITHTTPNRLAAHLRKLQRDGEALLALPPFLTPIQEAPWEVRVWRCLDKIADRDAFKAAVQRDKEDIGEIDLLGPERSRSAAESDELLRRRINRRLGTLASVLEKVEACADAELPKRTRKRA